MEKDDTAKQESPGDSSEPYRPTLYGRRAQ